MLSIDLEPITDVDGRRLADGLQKLTASDSALRVRSDSQSGRTIIAGAHELHLEMILDVLKREFGVSARVGRPRVRCREALTRSAEADLKHARHLPSTA